jgi:biotin carboxyl carrier protein
MDYAIRAEMVASVHSVVVEAGGSVTTGDTLMILESMKMEIPVVTEFAGTVREISVVPGDVVQEGDVLAILDVR